MVDLFTQHGVGDAVVRAANGAQRARVALVRFLGRDVCLLRRFVRIVGKGVGVAEEHSSPAVQISARAEQSLFHHEVKIAFDLFAALARHGAEFVHSNVAALAHHGKVARDTRAAALHPLPGDEHGNTAGKEAAHGEEIFHHVGIPAVGDDLTQHGHKTDAENAGDGRADD